MERRKWPWRRTAARPIAAAADDATRRRPPQDVCRPRRRRTRWSGGCGPRDALGKSPLLEQNFACFRLRFRQDLGRRSEDRRRQSVFEPRVVWQSAPTQEPNTAALEGADGVSSWCCIGPSAARGCVVAPNARPSVRSVVCSPPQSATTHPTGGTVRPIPSVSEAQRLVNCRHPHGRSEPSAATKSPTRRRWRALVASGRGGERLVPARVGRGEVAMGGMNRGAPASCGAGTRVALVVLCPLARVRGGENRDQNFGLFRVA